jgi:multidrug efflux pump
VAPKELNHFNRQRAAIISANIAPGYTLGEALAFMDQAAAETLTPSARTTLDGQSREFRESGQQLWSFSCWHWPSSIWCSRRSSRASSRPW